MFIVRTRDAYGNDRASGGDAVTATLMQAGTAEVVHANVTDTGEGSYSVRYKLVVTDGKDYTLRIHVNDGLLGTYAVKALAGSMSCAETLSTDQLHCVVRTLSDEPQPQPWPWP